MHNLLFDPLGTEHQKLYGQPQVRLDQLFGSLFHEVKIPEDERARLHARRDSNSDAVLAALDELGEIRRQRAEEQQKAAAAAELEAHRKDTLSRIEAVLESRLRDFIEEEVSTRKPETLTPETLTALNAFREFCASFEAPMLCRPANPIIVAAFLVKEA